VSYQDVQSALSTPDTTGKQPLFKPTGFDCAGMKTSAAASDYPACPARADGAVLVSVLAWAFDFLSRLRCDGLKLGDGRGLRNGGGAFRVSNLKRKIFFA
jgi:hypothetical protein